MLSRHVIVLLGLLFISCNKEIRPEKPKNLIEKERMITILYDLYLINAAKNVNSQLLVRQGFAPDRYIYSKHSIDSLQFATSNSYYAYDTDEYDAMVDEVRKRLERDKDNIQKLQKAEQALRKKKQDSIREANKKKAKKRDTLVKIQPSIKAKD